MNMEQLLSIVLSPYRALQSIKKQRKMVLNNACLAVKTQFSVMFSRTRFAGFIEILLERYQVLYKRIKDIIIIFYM